MTFRENDDSSLYPKVYIFVYNKVVFLWLSFIIINYKARLLSKEKVFI